MNAGGRKVWWLWLGLGIALVGVGGYLLTREPRIARTSSSAAFRLPHDTHDFIVSASLSPEKQQEARALYATAGRLLDRYADNVALAERYSGYLEWASFLLSSFLVILAGYFGHVARDANEAAGVLPAATQPEKPKPRGRKRLKGAAKPTTPGKFASMVGVIAALSAVSTGASSKLQTSANANREKAQRVSDDVVKMSKTTARPIDEAEVDLALESLRQTLRKNSI